MERTKKIVSIILVTQWVISTTSILFLMLLGLIETDSGLDLLKSYSAITSGFVGIVIGHMFSSSGSSA